MSQFKIGDLVETIDDQIRGYIKEIKGDIISMEDEDGFVFQFPTSALMLRTPPDLSENISYDDTQTAKIQKLASDKRIKSKAHLRNEDRAFTVDLHIEKLVDSIEEMSKYDILNFQLETAKRQLEFGIRKRMLKIVFIHGVGEGVLKMELHTLLRRYDNLQFYDADFKTYGFGATEVRIFQND